MSDSITLDLVSMILKRLHWKGPEGIVAAEIITDHPVDRVESFLKKLEESKFVVSQYVSGERRFYHAKYY